MGTVAVAVAVAVAADDRRRRSADEASGDIF
jgi:hypothetical protein